jgi:hypothetical protein
MYQASSPGKSSRPPLPPRRGAPSGSSPPTGPCRPLAGPRSSRAGSSVALADPVGLYFNDLATAGWATPDGSDAKAYWTLSRGSQDHPVRAVYEVPPDKPFSVGDITINGTPIAFGAQIVDFISMKLTAVACRFGQSATQPMTSCVTQATPPAAAIQERTAGASTINATR